MAQNANNQDDESSTNNDGTRVSEEDLYKLKYGDEEVDGSDEDSQDDTSDDDENDNDSEDTGDDDGKTDDETKDDDSEEDLEEDSDDDDSEFVKEFPNIKGETLVDYARNLEATISSSNKEGKRLADENASLRARVAELETGETGSTSSSNNSNSAIDELDPQSAYIKQKMDEEIDVAFTDFKKSYPQVDDTSEYNKFVSEVKVLSQTIWAGQKRLAPPRELYSKAAAILGWEPSDKVDNKDRLKVAMKDRAAVAKTTSSTGKKAPKSRVTDAMIRANRKMYPNKTDEEIRKELEPYIK